jgi:hypothetical protein
MYKAFNIESVKSKRSFLDQGSLPNEANSSAVKTTLDSFITNKKPDGTKLRDHWFPEIDAHVFISHSHKDPTEAKNLAGYLKEMHHLNSFIDSCVWSYSDHLLRQIDNEYCWNKENRTYIYENRNGSTSHVHMRLATALTKILDRCGCVIFMQTPNSISSSDVLKKTHSPWIYFELGMIKLLREQSPRRLVKESASNMSRGEIQASIPAIDYSVDLSALIEIDFDTLNNWDNLRSQTDDSVHSLDLLYKVVAGK